MCYILSSLSSFLRPSCLQEAARQRQEAVNVQANQRPNRTGREGGREGGEEDEENRIPDSLSLTADTDEGVERMDKNCFFAEAEVRKGGKEGGREGRKEGRR